MDRRDDEILKTIFPSGDLVLEPYRKYYTGTCYEKVMVPYTSQTGCTAANVTFAPSTRNDWHSHHGGQLLLVIAGEGWYQEAGKEAQRLKPGDVIEIAPGVKHWHGAVKNSWYVHVAIKEISTAGAPEWFGPVTDEEYERL